jgi:hypothetical protein
MAYYDAATFLSTAQAITTTADSTLIYDTCGVGVGVAPTMIGAGGLNTHCGFDIGAGDGMAVPEVLWTVTTTGTGAGTITFSVSAAPDNGSYAEGTYQTLAATQAFVGTSLKQGQQIKLIVPPFPQGTGGTATQAAVAYVIPRFYKFTYTVASSATVSVSGGILLNAPDARTVQIYGNNYVSTL